MHERGCVWHEQVCVWECVHVCGRVCDSRVSERVCVCVKTKRPLGSAREHVWPTGRRRLTDALSPCHRAVVSSTINDVCVTRPDVYRPSGAVLDTTS